MMEAGEQGLEGISRNPPVLHNFNPGPGVLPREVLQNLQKEFLDYGGTNVSVLEMSHRQPEFLDISRRLESSFREFMKVPDNFNILLLNGGATM